MKPKKQPPDELRKSRALLNRLKRLNRGYTSRKAERSGAEPLKRNDDATDLKK